MNEPNDAPRDVPAGASRPGAEVSVAGEFRLVADWHYEIHGRRRHYLVEAFLAQACIGRAFGWFEPGRQFVLQKIEVDDAVRSRGCGSAILAKLRLHARRAACVEMLIEGVRASNYGAIRLYESLGARRAPGAGPLQTYILAP